MKLGGDVLTLKLSLALSFLCLCYHCSTGGVISQDILRKKVCKMVFYRGGDVVIFTFFVRFLFGFLWFFYPFFFIYGRGVV